MDPIITKILIKMKGDDAETKIKYLDDLLGHKTQYKRRITMLHKTYIGNNKAKIESITLKTMDVGEYSNYNETISSIQDIKIEDDFLIITRQKEKNYSGEFQYTKSVAIDQIAYVTYKKTEEEIK